MISCLPSKCQDFRLRSLQFHFIKRLKNSHQKLKTCYFEASEDIITKFKWQALHIIRIKYWKVGGTGNPPSLIPALWNIGILLHKHPPPPNIFGPSVLLVWIFRIFCSPKSMQFFDCHCQMQLIAMARLLHRNVHNLADVNNQLLLISATSDWNWAYCE